MSKKIIFVLKTETEILVRTPENHHYKLSIPFSWNYILNPYLEHLKEKNFTSAKKKLHLLYSYGQLYVSHKFSHRICFVILKMVKISLALRTRQDRQSQARRHLKQNRRCFCHFNSEIVWCWRVAKHATRYELEAVPREPSTGKIN